MPSFTNRHKSFIWAAMGTFLFSLFYASGKLISSPVPIFQLLLLRYIGGLLVILVIARMQFSLELVARSKYKAMHLCRATLGSGGALCFIYGGMISPISDVTALGLTDGIFTIILSAFFLKEVIYKRQWFWIFVCAFGAFYVVYFTSKQPVLAGMSQGLILALAGSILISVESILIKVLVQQDASLTVLFYVNLFALIMMGVPAILFWSSIDIGSALECMVFGPIAIAAQFCWMRAYQLEKVSIVTPVNYTWVCFSAVIGYFLLNEDINVHTLLGSTVICVGGYFLMKKDERVDT
jgi:drug/metabolite transporter (DMT)-like permease